MGYGFPLYYYNKEVDKIIRDHSNKPPDLSLPRAKGGFAFDKPIMTFADPIKGMIKWAENAKEWKEKGIIQGPKHEKMCHKIEGLYKQIGLTLDEDENVEQELDDNTIARIIGRFKEYWGFSNVEGDVAMLYLQKNILKDVKGNPKYVAEFLSIYFCRF